MITRRRRSWRHARFVFAPLLLAGASARPGHAQVVEFDHSKCPATGSCTQAQKISAKQNQVITIWIRNTQPDAFTYTVAGVKPPAAKGLQSGKIGIRDTSFTIAHDRQFAGYVITAQRKLDNAPSGTLPNAVFTLEVQTSEYKATFAGGFAITGLRDEAVALQPVDKSDPPAFTLVEDGNNRDRAHRAVATYVHLWHTLHPSLALSFGLGLDNTAGQDYFYGLTWRLGDQGALTFGGVVGTVKGTPAGKNIGSTVTDANALNARVNHTAGSLFFAISFPFLGNGSAELAKPFKGATTGGDGGGGGGGGDAAQPPTDQPKTSSLKTCKGESLAKFADAGKAVPLCVVLGSGETPTSKTKLYWWTVGDKTSAQDGDVTTDEEGVAKITVTPVGLPASIIVSTQHKQDPPASPSVRFTVSVTPPAP